MLLPPPPSLLFSSLPVFAGEDEHDYHDDDDVEYNNHEQDNNDHDLLSELSESWSWISPSRAGQFMNMKNWDDSTNYGIPIARCYKAKPICQNI